MKIGSKINYYKAFDAQQVMIPTQQILTLNQAHLISSTSSFMNLIIY